MEYERLFLEFCFVGPADIEEIATLLDQGVDPNMEVFIAPKPCMQCGIATYIQAHTGLCPGKSKLCPGNNKLLIPILLQLGM